VKANAVTIPNAVMMIEHYNRLGRLLQNHVPGTLEVNIETKFTGDHEHGFRHRRRDSRDRSEVEGPGGDGGGASG